MLCSILLSVFSRLCRSCCRESPTPSSAWSCCPLVVSCCTSFRRCFRRFSSCCGRPDARGYHGVNARGNRLTSLQPTGPSSLHRLHPRPNPLTLTPSSTNLLTPGESPRIPPSLHRLIPWSLTLGPDPGAKLIYSEKFIYSVYLFIYQPLISVLYFCIMSLSYCF